MASTKHTTHTQAITTNDTAYQWPDILATETVGQWAGGFNFQEPLLMGWTWFRNPAWFNQDQFYQMNDESLFFTSTTE